MGANPNVGHSEEALSRIGEQYAIEKEIRGLPEAERLRVRQSRSKPLLLALYDSMEEKVADASRKDRLPAAFWYLLNRKEALAYFCEDGLAEIDNNAAERALRSVCLGKKTGSSSVMITEVTGVRWCTA